MATTFIERFSLPTRVGLLAALGMCAWLIAFSRIILYGLENEQGLWHPDILLMICLACLNGGLMLLNTWVQLRTMLRDNMRWVVNNRDIICWISLLGSYASALYIQHLWQPTMLDQILLAFLIVIHSIHTMRFSIPVSVVVLLTPATMYGWNIGGTDGLFIGLFVANQQLVLWGMGLGVLRELLETQKLELKTGQLRLAQARLADTSRQEERRKIRQDLHDRMGHELAAMNMNLQLLEYKIPELAHHPERQIVDQTRDSCQRLFGTLGEVVGELRRQTNQRFYDQRIQMVEKGPGLEITLNCDEELVIQDDVVADNLLCCIQEGITNILKHSKASKATIDIVYKENDLQVSIMDNGRPKFTYTAGNGLTGMQGRMTTLGGSASANVAEDGGFQVSLTLPREVLL
ncbi:MAG: histidine kinase [Thalassolituus sp.]